MNTWAVSAVADQHWEQSPRIDSLDGGRISPALSARGLIEREFLAAALDLLNQGGAGKGKVLELGCGVGHFTELIARNGFQVNAVDGIDAVVRCARERLGGNKAVSLSVQKDEIGTSGFGDSEFDFVISLRMLPWLRDSSRLLSEVSRVLKPGGMLVLGLRNKNNLQDFIDPATNPLLSRVRSLCKRLFSRVRGKRRTFQSKLPQAHSRQEVQELLDVHGFEIVGERIVGIGPLTMFGRHVVPDSMGIGIAQAVGWCAAQGFPLLRRSGVHALVLARRRKTIRGGSNEKIHE